MNGNDSQKSSKRLHSELTPPQAGAAMTLAAIRTVMEEALQQHGLDTIKEDIHDLKESVTHVLQTGETAIKQSKQNEARIESIECELKNLKCKLSKEHDARLKLETFSRRSNLRFLGIPEEEREQSEALVRKILREKMDIQENDIYVERCHRLGPKSPGKTRPIIIKFTMFKDRELVWGNKLKLRGTDIFITEDFPAEIESKRSVLMPVFKEVVRDRENFPVGQKPRVALVVDKLFINTEMYTIDTLDRLPERYKLANITTKSNDLAVWFWGQGSPLSSYYGCEFEENGITYNSSQQYVMAAKARYFEDPRALEMIIDSSDPFQQTKIRVNNFNFPRWQNVAPDFMKTGTKLKFQQNENLKRLLIETGTRMIGEATDNDKIWGCGLRMSHEDVSDPTKWQAGNKMGIILMDIRRELR